MEQKMEEHHTAFYAYEIQIMLLHLVIDMLSLSAQITTMKHFWNAIWRKNY